MIQGMNHFTITAEDRAKTLDYYCGLLGLKEGHRPDLGFPGAWLYAGDGSGRAAHLLGPADAGAAHRRHRPPGLQRQGPEGSEGEVRRARPEVRPAPASGRRHLATLQATTRTARRWNWTSSLRKAWIDGSIRRQPDTQVRCAQSLRRRARKASHAASCSRLTYSSAWCAWAMWPGPQTTVGDAGALEQARPRCRRRPAWSPRLAAQALREQHRRIVGAARNAGISQIVSKRMPASACDRLHRRLEARGIGAQPRPASRRRRCRAGCGIRSGSGSPRARRCRRCRPR